MTGTQPQAPVEQLLEAAKGTLELVDFPTLVGLVMKVRHGRWRASTSGEWPCLSIVFISDDSQQAELNRNEWEVVRILSLELHMDMEWAAEDSGDDPTGLGDAARALAAAVTALQDPASPLGQLVDYCTPAEIKADDRNQSDKGRMVRALDVQYRVRSDDQNILLAVGADA